MTTHPALPKGYRPFTDAADLTAELAAIDQLTADVFRVDVPLRDRVATLVADWRDTTTVLSSTNTWHVGIAKRQQSRRGLA